MKDGLLRAVGRDGGAIGHPEVIFQIVIPDACGKEQEVRLHRKMVPILQGASDKTAASVPIQGPRRWERTKRSHCTFVL